MTFGGFAEDGPGAMAWPYTSGQSVYVPRAHTDKVVALSDFLFELNNAIRHPALSPLTRDATAGTVTTGRLRDAASSSRRSRACSGSARCGPDVKATMGGGRELNRYDAPNYLKELNDVTRGPADPGADRARRAQPDLYRGHAARQDRAAELETQWESLQPAPPRPRPHEPGRCRAGRRDRVRDAAAAGVLMAVLDRRVVVTGPPALVELSRSGDVEVLGELVELLGDAETAWAAEVAARRHDRAGGEGGRGVRRRC